MRKSCCSVLSATIAAIPSDSSACPLRALLFRRPTDPQLIEIAFDGTVYLVRLRRHRQARRYTLRIQAATREVVLTMPPRGSVREARAFAQKHGGWIAARLKRLPRRVPFADGLDAAAARRAASHRASPRRAARCGPKPATTAPLALRRRRPRRISHAALRDYLKREAKRELEAASRRYAAQLGVKRQARLGARPVEPLGLMLDHRRAVLFVAADPRAALRARLSRRARGRASGRDEPLARGSGGWSPRICPDWQRAKAWLDAHGADAAPLWRCRRSGR